MSEKGNLRPYYVKGEPEPFYFPAQMAEQDVIRILRQKFPTEFAQSDAFKKRMGKSTPEQAALIGAGKTANSFVEGSKYLYDKLTGDDESANARLNKTEQDNEYMRYLREQQGGAVSMGETLPYFALPMGSASKPIGGALGLIPKMNKAGQAVKNSVVADSVLTGGIFGGLNIEGDALTGAGAGLAGSMVAKGAAGLLKPTNKGLEGVAKTNAEKGVKLGYKLTPAQRTGSSNLEIIEKGLESNPLTSGAMLKTAEHNQANSNRIVAESLGFKGKNQVTPQMLDEVSTGFTKRFNEAIKGNTVHLDDKFLNDLAELESEQTRYWIRNKEITDVVDAALEDLEKGFISAEKYQTLSSKLVKASKAAFRGANSNPEYGFALAQLKDSLDSAAERSLGKENKKLFQNVRKDYKTYIQLMKNGVINEDTGNVSLKQLGNILRREDKRGFRQGKNESDLYNATRFERTFPDSFGNSGTTQRQAIQNLVGQGLLAGGLGLTAGDSVSDGIGLGLAVPGALYGFGKFYNSPVGNSYFTKGLLPVLSKDIKDMIANKGGLLAIGASQ